MTCPCSASFGFWLGVLVRCFRPRQDLLLENLALRQQLTVLKRRHPQPKLSPLDKLFWISARRFWSAWRQSLIIVTPETVVRWHRTGFRLYWRLISGDGLGATSSTVALNSPDGFPTLAFESGQHFGGTGKGPVVAALLEVVQSFRKGPVDNGFRREHNLALFIGLGFQKVADPDSDLLAHALRDYQGLP
jgi:hypothetical protein